MKRHYVYLLRCSTSEFYTGYTVDPENRLHLHNRGRASKFTRSRLPVEIVHLESFATKSEALRREIQIKKMSRKQKMQLFSGALCLEGNDIASSL